MFRDNWRPISAWVAPWFGPWRRTTSAVFTVPSFHWSRRSFKPSTGVQLWYLHLQLRLPHLLRLIPPLVLAPRWHLVLRLAHLHRRPLFQAARPSPLLQHHRQATQHLSFAHPRTGSLTLLIASCSMCVSLMVKVDTFKRKALARRPLSLTPNTWFAITQAQFPAVKMLLNPR